jgi:hypothetical protein
MVPETWLLILLTVLVDRSPVPPRPKRRGRPPIRTDRLLMKAVAILIVRQLPRVHSLLAALEEPTGEMQDLRALPTELRVLLDDKGYRDPDLDHPCTVQERVLVATQPGCYPHTDLGDEVRRLFHRPRSRAIQNFNEQFKGILHGHHQVPTCGLVATRRFVLGAVFVY